MYLWRASASQTHSDRFIKKIIERMRIQSRKNNNKKTRLPDFILFIFLCFVLFCVYVIFMCVLFIDGPERINSPNNNKKKRKEERKKETIIIIIIFIQTFIWTLNKRPINQNLLLIKCRIYPYENFVYFLMWMDGRTCDGFFF